MKARIVLAALLLAIGILVNPWSLGRLLSPDGYIGAIEVRHIIYAFEFGAVALAVLVLPKVPKVLRAASFLACLAAAWVGWREHSLWRGWTQPPVRPLDELCEWLTTGDDAYIGKGALEAAGERVRRLADGGHPSDLARARYEYADMLQRHGMVTEAIAELEAAEAAAVEHGFPAERLHLVRKALGVAYIRRGEQNHCVMQHNRQSCVFPITGEGVWPDTAASTSAIERFEQCLAYDAEDTEARWLLNLAYMTAGRYPDDVPGEYLLPLSLFESDVPVPRFVDVGADLGIDAFNLVGGVVFDDMDGDGFVDVVTSTFEPCSPLIYYHNEGDGTFADWSERSRLAEQTGGFNLYQADYDNDGRLDLFVVRGAWMRRYGRQRSSLLHQLPDGTFEDVTAELGLDDVADPNLAAAWADYDNDGRVDIYLGCEEVNGDWSGPSQLYRNREDGRFENVAKQAGVENNRNTKAPSWGDYDDDGDQDLFISNYKDPNRLYRNEGDGTFADVAPELGLDQDPPANMTFASWFWDVDNDGHLDLFVAGYGAPHVGYVAEDYMGLGPESELLRLHRNDGNGGFVEVTEEYGLGQVRKPMGANFGDVDNDGYLDMYLGTGAPPYAYLVPNVMLRNVEGKRFADVTVAAGVGHLQKGHAVAFADMDNDGDQDIYHQLGGFYADDAYSNAVYLNPGNDHHWLNLRLVGTTSNRAAIGARITVIANGPDGERRLHRVVGTGGSFGANSLQQEIGLGTADRVSSIEIWWPTTGERQVFLGLAADRFWEITEGDPEPRELDRPKIVLPVGG